MNDEQSIKQSKPQLVKRHEKTKSELKAESFVREIKTNGYNLTKAYKVASGNMAMDDKTASTSGSRLLRSEGVQALLSPLEQKATVAITNMIADPDHKDHFNAAKLTLAYLHGTPVARSENVNVSVTLEDILRPSKPVNS